MTGFTHLHTHSEFSALDGLSTVDEIVGVIKEQGGTAIGVADHGNVVAHPALYEAAKAAGIKAVMGMEAYFVNDRHSREDPYGYWHICLFAMSDKGLRNLWAISTEGEIEGKYADHARIDWDTLERLGEDIIVTTACLRGPVTQPYLEGKETKALANLSRLKKIFGDRLYIEIHANQIPEQIKANKWLTRQSEDFDVPLVAAVDAHYARPEARKYHQAWLPPSDGKLFGGGQDYHLATEDEVRGNLKYLDPKYVTESIDNTGLIADRCDAKVEGQQVMPVFSRVTQDHPDPVQHDIDRALEICADNWERRTLGKTHDQDTYFARFEREIKLLIEKGFIGYFLMVADLVNYAKENGILVGPGRGSGGGSLVAYLMGITEIDPVEYDLLFERFMTDGRTSLPDFDIDFPSTKKQFMIDRAKQRWGNSHVCGVGTHLRLKNKGSFRNAARAIQDQLGDYATVTAQVDQISAIIKEAEAATAGLGLSWEELMDVAGDQLEPYRRELPLLFEYAESITRRLKTYSRHAAGLIIDPDRSLIDELPMFVDEDTGERTTQFDLKTLEKLGFIKFDLLNLRNLDTIQMSVDLIKEKTGNVVDVTQFKDELKDPKVFEQISKGWTLGIFQIETNSGTRLCKRYQPTSISELADVITLVRPGPMNSGLTAHYLDRRKGIEDVTYRDERMRPILESTEGAMIYQEQVMALCIELAGYNSTEADEVRSILGKKKVEEAKKEKPRFLERAVACGTSKQLAEEVWSEMEEFSRYSFGKAHAIAYAILAHWTGWLKVHYPLYYMTAALSTVKMERIPEFIGETRRLGFDVLPPDINDSGTGFTAAGNTVRYGFKSIKGIGDAASASIMVGQPYVSFDDYNERSGPNADRGITKLLAHIGAFDSMAINRRALEQRLAALDLPPRTQCIFFREEGAVTFSRDGVDSTLPCNNDWENEPREIGKSGKPKKRKPLPKACSRACRGFTPKPEIQDADVVPYTPAEIREIEMEALGIYLSSTPFDEFDQDVLSEFATGYEITASVMGKFDTVGLVTRVKEHRTKTGNPMMFLSVATHSGDLDVTVFSENKYKYEEYLKIGQMMVMRVSKNPRGTTLEDLTPL